MADSARLPGAHYLPDIPQPLYRWMSRIDAVAFVASSSVDVAALTARVAALESGTAGGVASFNGRSGTVVPLIGDYSDWFQPASDTLDTFAATDLTTLADGDQLAWDATTETFVAAAPAGVPYYIASGETYRVPEYRQTLFSMPITCDGYLVVDGYLIGV